MAPLLITINPVFVLSSRHWRNKGETEAKGERSEVRGYRVYPDLCFSIFFFPQFHLFLPLPWLVLRLLCLLWRP